MVVSAVVVGVPRFPPEVVAAVVSEIVPSCIGAIVGAI